MHGFLLAYRQSLLVTPFDSADGDSNTAPMHHDICRLPPASSPQAAQKLMKRIMMYEYVWCLLTSALSIWIQPRAIWWIWRGWPAVNCQTAATCYLFLTRMHLAACTQTPSFMRFCLCLAALTILYPLQCRVTPQFHTISTSQLDSSESCSCFPQQKKRLATNIINR